MPWTEAAIFHRRLLQSYDHKPADSMRIPLRRRCRSCFVDAPHSQPEATSSTEDNKRPGERMGRIMAPSPNTCATVAV